MFNNYCFPVKNNKKYSDNSISQTKLFFHHNFLYQVIDKFLNTEYINFGLQALPETSKEELAYIIKLFLFINCSVFLILRYF